MGIRRFALTALSVAAVCAAVYTARAKGGPPLGLPEPPSPQDNPTTPAKVALGRRLYFDKALSKDGTVSCATCHDPARGWTDQSRFSTGVGGQTGARSAPTVLNSAYNDVQFWDGRAPSLEEQAKGPMLNPVEMASSSETVAARVRAQPAYGPLFERAFGQGAGVTFERVAMALAAFERTVLTGDSPYDRFQAGRQDALSAAQQRGMALFFTKARCSECHSGFNFTDSDFHNLGVGMSAEKPDLGRFAVTGRDQDRGAFKTPTLRNLTDTAPYMHDGSQATLEEVVDFYDRGGEANAWLDGRIKPLGLTAQEKADLVAFLRSLQGTRPR